MSKLYRNFMMAGVVALGLAACGDDLTITETPPPVIEIPPPPPPPEVPNITSFSVSPSTATLVLGSAGASTIQATYNLITKPGVTGTVTWGTSNGAVATVSGSGLITANSVGGAVITATVDADGETATQSVAITVRGQVPAQISINSVTMQATGLPVVLNAVAGQIEINTLFNPGEQVVDSLVVYIGGVQAASQVFATSPSAGPIDLSVNTAAYTVTPTAAVTSWKNGPTTISAAIFPHGQAAPTATNTINIVLVNADGWMATLDQVPTNFATGPGGLTYWGGPTAAGLATYTLRPVIYTPGRSVTAVTWGLVGKGIGCFAAQGAAGAYTRSFGYTAAGANVACTGSEYPAAAALAIPPAPDRHNVGIVAAIDNSANPYPVGGLIPNLTIFGSTPDSMRYDWTKSGTVATPAVAGAEGAFWVNASWPFNPGGTTVTDAGVGALSSTWMAYANTGTAGWTPPAAGTAVTTGADLAETNTNITAVDGYTARATGTDLLGNLAVSATSAQFGDDQTAPMLRYATIGNLPSLYVDGTTASPAEADSTVRAAFSGMYGVNAGGSATGDTVHFVSAAAGTNDSVQTEAIDNRSGLSRAVLTSRRFAQGGTTGATTTLGGCTTSVGGFGAAYVDGWRPLPQQHITCGSVLAGYYTSGQSVVDNAGNSSTVTFKRTLAFDPGQPAVTGVSPNAIYTGNAPAPFTIGAQDDLEVIDGSIRIHYPNLTQGDGVPTASDGLRWMFGGAAGSVFATRFDASIVNPILPTASIDQFTVSIQEACIAAASPAGSGCAFTGDPIASAGIYTVAKPDSVGATVRDVFGSFFANFAPGASTGVSTELASPILSGTVPAVGTYSVTYDASGVCPQGGIVGGNCVTAGINFRADGISGSTYSYRASQSFNTTLPIFTRVDLFGLNANGEWEFIQRITVPANPPTSGTIAAGAGTITGSQNWNGVNGERYWVYAFTSVPAGYALYRAIGVNGSGYGLASDGQ